MSFLLEGALAIAFGSRERQQRQRVLKEHQQQVVRAAVAARAVWSSPNLCILTFALRGLPTDRDELLAMLDG